MSHYPVDELVTALLILLMDRLPHSPPCLWTGYHSLNPVDEQAIAILNGSIMKQAKFGSPNRLMTKKPDFNRVALPTPYIRPEH